MLQRKMEAIKQENFEFGKDQVLACENSALKSSSVQSPHTQPTRQEKQLNLVLQMERGQLRHAHHLGS